MQQHLFVVRREIDQAADDGAARAAHIPDHVILQRIDRRIRFYLHPREELLPALAIGNAVIEDQRDHDIEHVAEQPDESPARGLTGCQLSAYALRDRRDTGLHLLAELFDDGAVEAFLAAEVILNGGEVDPSALGERARACALEAARSEQLESCIKDTAAGLFAALVGTLGGNGLRSLTSLDPF